MKSINTNNYEELFLLYADGELTAHERQAVEEFVLVNKEYEEEFALIQESILPIEEIEMPSKDSLRAENAQANWEEKLLLLLDNEFNAEEANALKKEITTSEARENEWSLMRKTKLSSADKVVFPDKNLLYKKAPGKVVAWEKLRWLAAAMLIGFGLFAGYNYINDKQKGTSESAEAIAVQKKDKKDVKTTPNVKEESDTKDSNSVEAVDYVAQITEKKNEISPKENNANKQEEKNSKANEERKQQVRNDALANTQIIEKKTRAVKTINPPSNNSNRTADLDLATLDLSSQSKKSITDVDVSIKKNTANGIASFANNDNDVSNNKILYMDEEKVARSKPGIFLRKVKRFIERKTDIETGKNIKVAGFEIAIR